MALLARIRLAPLGRPWPPGSRLPVFPTGGSRGGLGQRVGRILIHTDRVRVESAQIEGVGLAIAATGSNVGREVDSLLWFAPGSGAALRARGALITRATRRLGDTVVAMSGSAREQAQFVEDAEAPHSRGGTSRLPQAGPTWVRQWLSFADKHVDRLEAAQHVSALAVAAGVRDPGHALLAADSIATRLGVAARVAVWRDPRRALSAVEAHRIQYAVSGLKAYLGSSVTIKTMTSSLRSAEGKVSGGIAAAAAIAAVLVAAHEHGWSDSATIGAEIDGGLGTAAGVVAGPASSLAYATGSLIGRSISALDERLNGTQTGALAVGRERLGGGHTSASAEAAALTQRYSGWSGLGNATVDWWTAKVRQYGG